MISGLYGFQDSVFWMLVGWVFTFGKMGFWHSAYVVWLCVILYGFFSYVGFALDQRKELSDHPSLFAPGQDPPDIKEQADGTKIVTLNTRLQCPSFSTLVHEGLEKGHGPGYRGTQDLKGQVDLTKKLLESTLPKDIISQVREISQVEGNAIAQPFDNVTIIFAKITGIHDLFETKPTVTVVGTLDKLYKKIDALKSLPLKRSRPSVTRTWPQLVSPLKMMTTPSSWLTLPLLS